MTSDQNDAIDTLEDILRVENQALLQGTLSDLAPLAVRKQVLLDELKGADSHRLQTALRLADKNQQLIGAALRGVRAAQMRLDQIRRASGNLDSYDKDGRARSIGSGAPSLERRA